MAKERWASAKNGKTPFNFNPFLDAMDGWTRLNVESFKAAASMPAIECEGTPARPSGTHVMLQPGDRSSQVSLLSFEDLSTSLGKTSCWTEEATDRVEQDRFSTICLTDDSLSDLDFSIYVKAGDEDADVPTNDHAQTQDKTQENHTPAPTTKQMRDLQKDLYDRILAILSSDHSPISYSEVQEVRKIVNTLLDFDCFGASGTLQSMVGSDLKFWLDIHLVIEQFRFRIGYHGPAGEWKAHKRSLTELPWKAHYKSHIVAHRELREWARKSKEQGTWIEEDQLDRSLSAIFDTLIQDPSCDEEDLVGGFKEYNQELFAWFN